MFLLYVAIVNVAGVVVVAVVLVAAVAVLAVALVVPAVTLNVAVVVVFITDVACLRCGYCCCCCCSYYLKFVFSSRQKTREDEVSISSFLKWRH